MIGLFSVFTLAALSCGVPDVCDSLSPQVTVLSRPAPMVEPNVLPIPIPVEKPKLKIKRKPLPGKVVTKKPAPRKVEVAEVEQPVVKKVMKRKRVLLLIGNYY